MPINYMPNNVPAWQQSAQFIAQCVIMERRLKDMEQQRKQDEYISTVVGNLLYVKPYHRLESGVDAPRSVAAEKKRAQSFIDATFEYVAPSLFVTSVLASGELVGSTIWGIVKYVSKDVIYNTLGATTAAVILQSADLIGYKNDVQQLFGIKNTGRRATLAIKMGGMAGKAIGAVAGSALSVYAELAVGGVVAPTLIPWVVGTGFFAGQIIGEVAGGGLGAGLNNLFFSTIGMVPASYQGIKQKGGKFAERIKNSRAEKRKVKEAKAAAKEQKEKAAPKVKKEAEQKQANKVVGNAMNANAQGAGAPEVRPAQLLLEGGNDVPVERLNHNAALVPASQAIKGPFVTAGINLRGGSISPPKVTIAPQRNKKQNIVETVVDVIPGEGGNKTVVGNPGGQHAVGLSARKKTSRKTTSRKEGQETISVNQSGKKKMAAQTKFNKKVTQLSQPIAPKNQGATPKNTKTKTNGQSVYEVLGEEVTQAGGEWQRVPTTKEKKAAVKQKFTRNIQPKNAIGNAIEQDQRNQGTSHSKKPNNRSGQNSQSLGNGRSIK